MTAGFWPIGQARLAILTGKSVKTVYNNLQELSACGYLEIKRTRSKSGNYGLNNYKLLIPGHGKLVNMEES